MRERNKIIMEYGTYMLAYFASYIASLAGLHLLSGALLIIEALYLYVHWVRESGSVVEMRALFTLAWVGGQGIACLKLSELQTDWHYITWLCFGLIYLVFGIGYEWGQKYVRVREFELEKNEIQKKRLFLCIMGLAVVSILCFAFEAVKVGFIPVFSDKPHAYSYFHVSGVHYFTISCILIPAITVLYRKVSGRLAKGEFFAIAFANVTALAIPFLCVSRFQLILAAGMAVFTYISMTGSFSLIHAGILIVLLIPAYLILTVLRSHSVEYLNGIFEMKNSHMPIFITQPYIYIANNYDNFNCLVEQLGRHSFGLKGLFPLWALTGLKFLFPSLVNFPLYVTKEELTTVTLFYDAYYDFGVFGMIFFGALLGAACYGLVRFRKKLTCPAGHIIYAQIAMYMVLSFFTIWFSNPTTWFYLILSGLVYLYVDA